MKKAIKMVLESIYDLEFLDTSHFLLGRGRHSTIRFLIQFVAACRIMSWATPSHLLICIATIILNKKNVVILRCQVNSISLCLPSNPRVQPWTDVDIKSGKSRTLTKL